MALGKTDAQIRKLIQNYDKSIIKWSKGYKNKTSQNEKKKTNTNKKKVGIIMTSEEAIKMIKDAKQNSLGVHFDKDHEKTGKSHDRYEFYKHITTFDQIKQAIKSKKMKSGDLKHDVQRGICIFGSSACGMYNLADYAAFKSDQPKVGIIDKLYELRGSEVIKPDSWMSQLTQMAHMACITGTDSAMYNQCIEEFALVTSNEIVKGIVTPMNVKEARQTPEWPKWIESIKKEFKALKDMDCFEMVPRSSIPKNKRPIKTRFVFKIKQNSDGSISKLKSRLIAQGFLLRFGVDYYDTYSSVVGFAAVRMLMAIAAHTDEKFTSADIGNAYIESKPDEDTPIFVEQPRETPELIEKNPEHYVYKLKRCLYGMPFAGRSFQRMIDEIMIDSGFNRMKSERCVWIKYRNEESPDRIIVTTYVDDLIILTKHEDMRQDFLNVLKKKFAKVTIEDNLNWILNIKMTRGESEGRKYIKLSQELAIDKVIEYMKLENTPGKNTPWKTNTELRKKKDDDELFTGDWKYLSVLGSLLYIANITRPDISYCISALARYGKDPNLSHHQALERVVLYLKKTKDKCLTYWGDSKHPFRITAAADAAYADCKDTMRSSLGWCSWLGGPDNEPNGPIMWGSRIGRNVALSTTESEVQALVEMTKDLEWARDFMNELGYEQKCSTRVLEDNSGCVHQANNCKGMKRARHYLVPLAKVNEMVESGFMHLHQTPTDSMCADIFTKRLSFSAHWRHTINILGIKHGIQKESSKVKTQKQRANEKFNSIHSMVDSDTGFSESRRTAESELNEYKKGIVDGSWLHHQCRRMIERNMNYMKSNKMDEGQEAESRKAVPSGSSNNVEASCKCTKSQGGDISGSKTNKVMSKMFSRPIENEEKKENNT